MGKPDRVRAGSPVFLEAFKRLGKDPKLRPGMDLLVLKFNTDAEMAKVCAMAASSLEPMHACWLASR